MRIVSFLLIAMIFAINPKTFAQEKSKVKYGKIAPEDFNIPDTGYLKNADAVYIADIGDTRFEGNSKSWFSLKFKRHVRIKVNNNNGVDAADFSIPMYFDGSILQSGKWKSGGNGVERRQYFRRKTGQEITS
jgi:hypothetical protein